MTDEIPDIELQLDISDVGEEFIDQALLEFREVLHGRGLDPADYYLDDWKVTCTAIHRSNT